MLGEKFYNDGIVNDLNIISDKLDKFVQYKKKEIADIRGVKKNVEVMRDYWKANPISSSPSGDAALASGSNFVHDFRDYVEGLRPEECNGIIFESMVASGDSMGSIGMTLLNVAPPERARKEIEFRFVEINNTPKRKERRKDICSNLQKISPHLVPLYNSAWENLETNLNDPERSAIFQMRELLSHVLDLLAPKDAIKGLPNFVPDPTAKDGVTRRHRLEYIATNKAKDNFNKKVIEDLIKAFLDNFEVLNGAHKKGSLNKLQSESFLFQADDLLNLLLGSVKLQ